ncbi:DUF5133 domain-containing protein [Streptomyces sp. NPDC056492]|uniref:DUF5133 domain-containing protein n=1 Tax=unclassified Streptomyces TaxID=2593676 RepID=UPI0036CCEA44
MTDAAEPCTAPDECGPAAGVLMALVPCTVTVAHRILDNAARTAGLSRPLMAQVVMSLRDDVCAPPGHDLTERAIRAEIERARTTTPAVAVVLFPSAFVLRQHVGQVRAARRRTLAAPEDPVQRAELENALYTLCVLTGRRGAHAALMAAEVYLAAHRLPGAGSAPAPLEQRRVPGGCGG